MPKQETSASEKVSDEAIGESISASLREKLEAQEPSRRQKEDLRRQHEGHLVRDTTSQLAVESLPIGPGVDVEAHAEIPDTYCFDCEEWIGVSGVELRGTPRSRTDAYYLGGIPTDVLQAKNGTVDTLTELADALIDRVERIDTRDDAYVFIETVLEETREANTGQVTDI
jgi:hypothetical protein